VSCEIRFRTFCDDELTIDPDRRCYTDYQVRKRINDGRGAARLNMDGDLSVSFPKSPKSSTSSTSLPSSDTSSASHPQVVSGAQTERKPGSKPRPPGHQKHAMITCKDREARLVDGYEVCDDESKGVPVDHASRTDQMASGQHLHDEEEEEEEEGVSGIGADVAWKFLLAGGIAGAGEQRQSARTCHVLSDSTWPFHSQCPGLPQLLSTDSRSTSLLRLPLLMPRKPPLTPKCR